MTNILKPDDYKLDYDGKDDYGKELSYQINPIDSQDDKSELESFFVVHAELFRFFKGIDGQITSILNSSIINSKYIEQFQTQVKNLLPTLVKLKFTIKMLNTATLSKTFEEIINQTLAYVQNEVIVDDLEFASGQLFDLLEKNKAAFAKEQEDVKCQREVTISRIVQTEIDQNFKGECIVPKALREEFEIALVFVQGGTFTMGAIDERDNDSFAEEKPAHRVTVSSFYLGKYPVTQGQWKAVMGENPSCREGDSLPVETVSWDDVQVFINRLNLATGKNYRLPTEAEWEYAARGGEKSGFYKFSGSNNLNDVAWHKDNSRYRTHPVGTKSPNELGIYDMSGNVWEWCQDWYGCYSDHAVTNPQGTAPGTFRVNRGGSCSSRMRDCRISCRNGSDPSGCGGNLGFRVALSL